MTRVRVLLILLVIGLLPVFPALAFWGDKENKDSENKPAAESQAATRRYHLSIPDKATEKELLDLFRSRRLLDEDVRVLTRLIEQRKARLANLEKNLKEEFSILPDTQYEYDADKMTIYKLASDGKTKSGTQAKEGTKNTQSSRKRTVHMKLKDEKQAKRFLGLNGSKRWRGREVRVLEATMREQQNNLKKANDLLASKFSLKAGRFYDYDEKTMKLYEIIPAKKENPPPK
jgi:hypothetical protein